MAHRPTIVAGAADAFEDDLDDDEVEDALPLPSILPFGRRQLTEETRQRL